jgi:hypothetical protein
MTGVGLKCFQLGKKMEGICPQCEENNNQWIEKTRLFKAKSVYVRVVLVWRFSWNTMTLFGGANNQSGVFTALNKDEQCTKSKLARIPIWQSKGR